MKDLEFEQESNKLKSTISEVTNLLKEERESLDKLYSDFCGEMEELFRMAEMKKVHISNLQQSEHNPYFARIDFVLDGEEQPQTIYIGKNGIAKNNEIIVTDWRAPISSLYYDAELGKCSYEAPAGTITGTMDLKRQFEIENGELVDFYDVDLVSSDELLQKYLNSNNDSRLKSIVATIQKEQNDVVRKSLHENLIVQGVAGSGKTTVALHRIAYLVYNYMKKIKQSQYLVIGPNPVFLKYIQSVLPDLDVTGVNQYTFENLAKEYIGEDISINPSEKKVMQSINKKMNNDIDKFKCSKEYQKMLEVFMNAYFLSLTSADLKLGDFKVLDSSVIREIFNATDTIYSSSFKNRIELTIDRICYHIEKNQEAISSEYNNYAYETFQNVTKEEADKYRSMFSKHRTEIQKNCRSTVRKYFSKVNISVSKLYKIFLQTIDEYNSSDYAYLSTLKKETLKNIKNASYDFEDLAALMYIKSLISPNKKYDDIKQIVVDEAQDLGEFNFAVLKKCFPNATFSIFGDLAQSIYDYRGIDSWESVNDIMFENKGTYINFNKSYRTTAEIMNVADEVSDYIGLGKSDLVVRHGQPVLVSSIEEENKIPEHIASKIQEFISKGYKSIAVISKTDLLSSYINDDLEALGIKIPNVKANDDLASDGFKVCTISNQLAKGLEFDAVIINNASEKIYSSDSDLDMKLLYVAITRALHEVDIVYSGQLTKPLKSIQPEVEPPKVYTK